MATWARGGGAWTVRDLACRTPTTADGDTLFQELTSLHWLKGATLVHKLGISAIDLHLSGMPQPNARAAMPRPSSSSRTLKPSDGAAARLSTCIWFALLLACGSASGEGEAAHDELAKQSTSSWQAVQNRYASVAVDGVPLSRTLGSVLNYTYSALTEPEDLERSVVYTGANHRLRSLLNAALSGTLSNATLRVGVVGGSISWGQGE